MYRVFISSVQREFSKERKAIAAAIRKDRVLKLFFDPFLFEETVACNRSPQKVYLDEVRSCDVYLGVFGDQYGNMDDAGVSPTEREYDAATEAGKYRITFVKRSAARREEKERAFIGKIEAEVVRKSFASTSGLAEAVCDALVAFLKDRDQIATKSFDESFSRGVKMDDLDENKFRDYVRMVKEAGKVSFPENITPREVLIRMRALDETTGRIVNGALPLFAKRPEMFKPSWELRCLQFWGNEVTKPLPALHTYNGTVFELVDQALEFVMSHVDFWVGAPTSTTSGAAPTKSEFPPSAIREAIVNAVCHRDYTDNGCVQVMLFRNRLEIINPGTLPKGWTAAKLLKAHDSKPRNEIIARAMSWTSYVEKSGSGTGDIINKCRAWGLPDPEYCPDNVDFKTIIWRNEKVTPVTNLTPVKNLTPVRGGKAKKTRVDALKGLITTGGRTGGKNLPPVGRVTPVVAVALNRFEQIVLALSNGAMGCVDLAQQLGIVETKNLRRRYARVLLDDGIIEFTIPEKPNSRLQKYRLTAKGKRLAAGLRANGSSPVKGEST